MGSGNHRLTVLALAALLCFSNMADETPYRPKRIVLAPKANAADGLASIFRLKTHSIYQQFPSLGLTVVNIGPAEDPVEVSRQYLATGLVRYAEPDFRIHVSAVPNDPEFSDCWALSGAKDDGTPAVDIHAKAAWDICHSAPTIIVAVIDSGVRFTHEDLVDNMWMNPREKVNSLDDDGNGIIDDLHGYNALNHSGAPLDDYGHGTHIAGIIGAVGNNNRGLAGVCWKVQLMALKFIDLNGDGDVSDAIGCLEYARTNGASVINLSWTMPDYSDALREAIDATRQAGIIVVAAAGNDRSDNDSAPYYPANYDLDNIVTVAGVNEAGQLDPGYSNWGATSVDLAAPGTDIVSTSFLGYDNYESMSGTSMAAGFVSGAVALLRTLYPTEAYQTILQRLYTGVDSDPSLSGKCRTGGRLNLYKTLMDAPRFTDVAFHNGLLRLGIIGAHGDCHLEVSTDLVHWQPESAANPTASQITLPLQSPGHAFYRIRRN